jgi:hypothetical protein
MFHGEFDGRLFSYCFDKKGRLTKESMHALRGSTGISNLNQEGTVWPDGGPDGHVSGHRQMASQESLIIGDTPDERQCGETQQGQKDDVITCGDAPLSDLEFDLSDDDAALPPERTWFDPFSH